MLEGDWGLGEEEGTYSFLFAACHCQGHSAVILHSGGGLGSKQQLVPVNDFPHNQFQGIPLDTPVPASWCPLLRQNLP